MSDSYSKLTERVARTLVDGIERVQKAQLDAVQRIREGVETYVPRFADAKLPFADSLPSPLAIARANFALAEEVLAAQKSYTLAILEPAKSSKAKKRD